MASVAALYTPEVLALATGLADVPLDTSLSLRASARSATCGSSVELGLALDSRGRIERVGIRAHSCAIGQAAAAIFAGAAVGKDQAGIAAAIEDIEAWLADRAAMPDWPGFAPIVPARNFPGRHGAIVLAWRAALEALSTTGIPG